MHKLEECSGRELQQLIGEGISTVVAPVGAIEHQDGHLPIGADALLADVVGAEVAQRLDEERELARHGRRCIMSRALGQPG